MGDQPNGLPSTTPMVTATVPAVIGPMKGISSRNPVSNATTSA